MARQTRRSRRFFLPFSRIRLVVELLEDRITPATIEWINPAGGAWDEASNWDLGRTPQPDDDVVIRPLDFQAVIDHANGADTVQSISSQGDTGTLAVTHQSSLAVTGSLTVPNLAVMTGGIVTGNNTGILTSNLRAEDGGQIHLPGVTEYHHGTIFTSITATGPTSLIDLPALTSLMATTRDPIPGETRLDFIAELGGRIKLPALTSVRGHPPDYFVGSTALRASNGGTFLFDTDRMVTFAADGSLIVEPGASVQAGQILLAEDSTLTVEGVLDATSVVVQRGYVTVMGAVMVSSSYTVMNNGTTSIEGGTVTVGDRFDNRGGAVFGFFGTINGDVTNAGMLSAGNLTINGNYTQTATGQLSLRLRGADNFDQLIVTGFATLDGTLNLTLAGGYQPEPGDQLQIVRFGAGTGAFARVTGNAPLFGILYVYQPREGVQPGVTLLF